MLKDHAAANYVVNQHREPHSRGARFGQISILASSTSNGCTVRIPNRHSASFPPSQGDTIVAQNQAAQQVLLTSHSLVATVSFAINERTPPGSM